MPGEQELDVSHDMNGTPIEVEDDPDPVRAPSLEETRAGFMLLDL